MGDKSPKNNAKSQRQKARKKQAVLASRQPTGSTPTPKDRETSPAPRP